MMQVPDLDKTPAKLDAVERPSAVSPAPLEGTTATTAGATFEELRGLGTMMRAVRSGNVELSFAPEAPIIHGKFRELVDTMGSYAASPSVPAYGDTFKAYLDGRQAAPTMFDRALEHLGVRAFDFFVDAREGASHGQLYVLAEGSSHRLEASNGRFAYEINHPAFGGFLSALAGEKVTFKGARITYQDRQVSFSPTVSYDSGFMSVTAGAEAERMFNATEGLQPKYEHLFSRDEPGADSGADLFGSPLIIKSYSLPQSPGALVSFIRYGDVSLILGTDPVAGRNVLAVRGLKELDLGIPLQIDAQALYQRNYLDTTQVAEAFTGSVFVSPGTIDDAALKLRVYGVRPGDSPESWSFGASFSLDMLW